LYVVQKREGGKGGRRGRGLPRATPHGSPCRSPPFHHIQGGGKGGRGKRPSTFRTLCNRSTVWDVHKGLSHPEKKGKGVGHPPNLFFLLGRFIFSNAKGRKKGERKGTPSVPTKFDTITESFNTVFSPPLLFLFSVLWSSLLLVGRGKRKGRLAPPVFLARVRCNLPARLKKRREKTTEVGFPEESQSSPGGKKGGKKKKRKKNPPQKKKRRETPEKTPPKKKKKKKRDPPPPPKPPKKKKKKDKKKKNPPPKTEARYYTRGEAHSLQGTDGISSSGGRKGGVVGTPFIECFRMSRIKSGKKKKKKKGKKGTLARAEVPDCV